MNFYVPKRGSITNSLQKMLYRERVQYHKFRMMRLVGVCDLYTHNLFILFFKKRNHINEKLERRRDLKKGVGAYSGVILKLSFLESL